MATFHHDDGYNSDDDLLCRRLFTNGMLDLHLYILLILTAINIFLSARIIGESSSYQQICSAFVIMLIPYTLAEIPGLFGREGEELPDSWINR